ncbi:MAG: hypothetical protein DRH04_11670 [Deltaproteobacteria bacterium]|nr:MAG: hypothetical protein DRH04_11670 [Deltaproteobacteria bacterium]
MGRQLLVFVKNDCPRCPAAKALGEKLRREGQMVRQFDVETADGLAEASFYGVMATPTLIVVDEDEEVVASWRGNVPPEDELLARL